MSNFDYDTHFTKMMNTIKKSFQAIVNNYDGTVNISFTTSNGTVTNNCSFNNVKPKERNN